MRSARWQRLALVALWAPSLAFAQVCIDGRTTLTLATAKQGRAVLGRADDYIREQSPWERGARMGQVAQVSAEAFLAFVRGEVREWTPEERAANLDVLTSMTEALRPYARWCPPEVLLVKTSGREDYGGAYTRQNAIVFKGENRGPISPGLLAHELWHVISRHQPALRDRLYAVIGFEYCGPLEWPEAMDRYRLTNPDCPINQHWIKIRYQGQEYHAMPVITARTERFGIDTGSSLGFLETRLLMVEKKPDGSGVQAVLRDGKPLTATFDEVENFYEQVGRNTSYLIHPEEAIASQFAMIVVPGRRAPPSPEILERLRRVLLETPAGAAEAVR